MTSPNPRGDMVRSLNICLICLSTLFMSLRFYVRGYMTKTLGIDDAFAFAAYAVLLTLSSMEIKEVSLGGGLQESTVSPGDLAKFFRNLPTMQLLYFSGTGLVRMSVVFFLPRLNNSKNYLRMVWALAAAIATVTIVSFSILLFECKHVPDLWNHANPTRKCLSSRHEALLMYTNASFGVALDICLVALPIWIVSKKMIFSANMIRVIGVFSVALFVIITGIIRLALIIKLNFSQDTTYRIPKASTWTDLEGQVGLWVASWPTLQPLIRTISFKMGFRSKLNSTTQRSCSKPNGKYSQYYSGSNSQPMSKLSKQGACLDEEGFDYEGEAGSEHGITGTNISANASTQFVEGAGPADGPMLIVKTTNVEISNEPGDWSLREQPQNHGWNAV